MSEDQIHPTKAKILDAASQLFFKSTFSQITVESIANKAGIAKGTVFNYFSSKEELAIAVLEMYFKKYKKQMEVLENTTDFTNIETVYVEIMQQVLQDIAEMPGMTIFLLQVLATIRYGKEEETALTKAANRLLEETILPMYTGMETMLQALNVPNAAVRGKLLAAIFDGLAFQFYLELIKPGDPIIKELADEAFKLIMEK